MHLSWDTDHLSVQVRAPYHSDSPPPSPPGPMDFLWEYEVVELFLLGAGERYTEIELGPHGHHLVLQLVGCRNVVRRCIPVQYQAEITSQYEIFT